MVSLTDCFSGWSLWTERFTAKHRSSNIYDVCTSQTQETVWQSSTSTLLWPGELSMLWEMACWKVYHYIIVLVESNGSFLNFCSKLVSCYLFAKQRTLWNNVIQEFRTTQQQLLRNCNFHAMIHIMSCHHFFSIDSFSKG